MTKASKKAITEYKDKLAEKRIEKGLQEIDREIEYLRARAIFCGNPIAWK